ncbi:MAG TPA: NrfD/PsrC family molybdoenzyme membrane anchor subunit, partial [Gemmatimonadota bacterium]|nr:NrfD/PsrC family molybdoenzyme membrane anchor subunit [Gemmatimonadota bacterium]
PPVWTWEVPTYFFVGGLAGMSGVVAAAARFVGGDAPLAVAALWVAALGAAASALLLISDLGRPSRFLHMLRVFKRRSPMSVGAWTLTLFGGTSTAALVLAAAGAHAAPGAAPALPVLTSVAVLATAVLGAVLGTYTGVLVGATVVPAWREHRLLLPAHFGIAGLGSSVALLLLLGFRQPALVAIGLAAAGAECLIGAAVELARRGPADRAVRRGRAGALLRGGGLLTGPAALVLWILGLSAVGAAAFLAGALLTRFGWLAAGRASALDPEAALSRR